MDVIKERIAVLQMNELSTAKLQFKPYKTATLGEINSVADLSWLSV